MKKLLCIICILCCALAVPAGAEEERNGPQLSWKIPQEYTLLCMDAPGTVELIRYPTRDYAGDGHAFEKEAYVYLPYGYDTGKQYNVVILCHGIGGSKDEWGLNKPAGKLKCIADNLIAKGEAEPFILVTPDGRAGEHFANDAAKTASFYRFGEELRNDLLPYMDAHYATYADYDEAGYDLSASREHRAIAGLSMGGMQTVNIGLCECVDLFSCFGAFSAAPTTYTAPRIAEELADSPYEIGLFYSVCGRDDKVAYASATAAINGLDERCDKLTQGENMIVYELAGGHDFYVWNLGFFHFAGLMFR